MTKTFLPVVKAAAAEKTRREEAEKESARLQAEKEAAEKESARLQAEKEAADAAKMGVVVHDRTDAGKDKPGKQGKKRKHQVDVPGSSSENDQIRDENPQKGMSPSAKTQVTEAAKQLPEDTSSTAAPSESGGSLQPVDLPP